MKIWFIAVVICFAPALAWCVKTINAPDKSDQRAHAAVRNGKYVALEVLIRDALQRVPGEVIDVELDDDDDEYEIEVLDADGVVWEFEYDARTGALRDLERDD